MGLLHHGPFAQWEFGSMRLWPHGNLTQWEFGPMGLWPHGTLGPQDFGPMELWPHVIVLMGDWPMGDRLYRNLATVDPAGPC